jgi:hypothetical protein
MHSFSEIILSAGPIPKPCPPPAPPELDFRTEARPVGMGLAWSVALVLPSGREWTRSEGAARSCDIADQEMDKARARIGQMYLATRKEAA